MQFKTSEIIGWYGTFAIILAYFLNSFSFISSSGLIYQLLNTTGAIGVIILMLDKKVYQSVLLNSIWAMIGLVSLIKIVLS